MKMVYIIIGVVVILAIAYLTYRKNHNLAFNEPRLKDAVSRVFSESGESTLKRSDFLLHLKQILGCTHKQALYMYGVARTKGLIVVDNKQVSKAP